MSITIDLPAEFEQELIRRAEIVGMDVPGLVRELLMERLAGDVSKPRNRLTPNEVMARLDRIADRHADLPVIDDRRESICSGRDE